MCYQEERGTRAGRGLPPGSPEVLRVRGVEPACHAHQEKHRSVPEAAGQDGRVSFSKHWAITLNTVKYSRVNVLPGVDDNMFYYKN